MINHFLCCILYLLWSLPTHTHTHTQKRRENCSKTEDEVYRKIFVWIELKLVVHRDDVDGKSIRIKKIDTVYSQRLYTSNPSSAEASIRLITMAHNKRIVTVRVWSIVKLRYEYTWVDFDGRSHFHLLSSEPHCIGSYSWP